ncbi:MAG: alanine racemase [Longimicrobiales bacterium]
MTRSTLEGLETPAGILDIERVKTNAASAVAYCQDHGLEWRPHVKTHKSLRVAQIQLEAGATGLTVATPHEAEVMATVCSNLLLAYPPVGASKLARLARLPGHVNLRVGLDAVQVLEPLAKAAVSAGREFGVLVEFDAGLGRVGVQTEAEAVRLAEAAERLDGTRFDGLMFYPGHIRTEEEARGPMIAELAERVGRFVEALGDAGLEPQVVSGGSTPTFWDSHKVTGLTEVRAGTWIYNDRDITGLGACKSTEVAYSVLATVVSVAVPGHAVVDAGSKALSKEPLRAAGGGYGVLMDKPEVTLKSLSEEHGVLSLDGSDWRPEIGEQVRIIPNHVCLSVNLQDRLWGIEDGDLTPVELEGRGRAPFRAQG